MRGCVCAVEDLEASVPNVSVVHLCSHGHVLEHYSQLTRLQHKAGAVIAAGDIKIVHDWLRLARLAELAC